MLLCSEGLTETAQAQTVQKKVLIVMVEFSNAATNEDARGSYGRIGESSFEEFKYRYHDYYDIVFQNGGNVVHPDASLDVDYSSYDRGWFQYGSFRRYVQDNSFGACDIVPVTVNSQSGQYGILNQLTYDDQHPTEIVYAKINWLQLANFSKPVIGNDNTNRNIAAAAFDAMPSILPANWTWDSVDAVLIIYAGPIIRKADGSSIGAFSEEYIPLHKEYSVVPERSIEGCFHPPSVWFHELAHSALYHKFDLYSEDGGRYSLMGEGYDPYTPPLLDPVSRMKLGWLGANVYNTAGDWSNIELPIVSELDNGNPPWALVIPLTGTDPVSSNWDYSGNNSYLVVENRRPVGWDMHLDRYDDPLSQFYGQTVTGFEGGFLVWGAGTLAPGKLRPNEADGDYNLDDDGDRAGDPYDFYTGATGRDRFGVWTSPGLIDRVRLAPDLCTTDLTRNVFLSFREYNTNSKHNQIGRLVLDRPIVEEHSYDTNPSDDESPGKYNNQRKICQNASGLYMAYNNGGLVYITRSTDNGESWRDVFVLSRIFGKGNSRWHRYADNIALASCESGVYVLYEEQVETDVLLSKVVGKPLIPSDCSIVYEQNIRKSFGTWLRPSVAAMDDFIVRVIPEKRSISTEDGLYAWTGTNGGNDWNGPVKLTGSDEFSRYPSVTARKSQEGVVTYFYDVVYQKNQDGNLMWYSSKHNVSALLWMNEWIPKLPHHDILQAPVNTMSVPVYKMSVVGSGNAVRENRSSIVLRQLDADWLSVSGNPTYMDEPRNVYYGLEFATKPQRDARIVSYRATGDDIQPNNLITWIEGNGEKMYFADNQDNPRDWYRGRSSTLMAQSMTSYPYAFLGAVCQPGSICEPSIGTTRTAISTAGWPANLWQISTKSRPQDLADGAVLLELATGKTIVVEDGNTHQRFRLKEPTLHDGIGQKIGVVRYNYDAPNQYWGAHGGTPFDTQSTSEIVTLVGAENVRFDLEVASDSVSDTTYVEAYLFDEIGQTILSTTSEYRIPNGITDTTLTLGLELPSGVPVATVSIHTRAWRGSMVGGSYSVTLYRDHYYCEPNAPKTASPGIRIVPGGTASLRMHPTEQRTNGSVTIESPFSGPIRLRLHTLLGREVSGIDIQQAERGDEYLLPLPSLRPGMYMISVTGMGGCTTGRIIVY
jgi:hypothetical protein